MEKLVKNVLDTLASLGNSERVALLSLLDDNQTAVVEGGFAEGEFLPTGHLISLENTPLIEVINSKIAHTYPGKIEGNLPFPCFYAEESCMEEVCAFDCLCLPLMSEEQRVIGIALVAQKHGVEATDYRQQTLNMLRTLIAAAMENARLFQLATTDSLTGLYVRRYFDIRLHEESVRVRRHGGVLSVLILDIDYFKRVNDQLGHLCGDKVLQEIAQIILTGTRQELDLPCRYGGEEFVILLPNTDSEGAFVVAERIRNACAHHTFQGVHHPLPWQITLSGGIASLSQNEPMSLEELLHRADSMLYAAKNAGRNRIFAYSHALSA